MPELPEVETVRLELTRVLVGKRVSKVYVDADDRIVFDKSSPAQVKKVLSGARVTAVGRKGKYLWLELDRRPWVILHFGMTGNAEILTDAGYVKAWGGDKLWAKRQQKLNTGERPRFCRLWLQMADGTQIAITDPRRFGRIRLAKDPLREAPVSLLGPDPLKEFPTFKTLKELLSRRAAPIKAVLLDQGLFAGVGNWIADEILYQAGIAPKRLAKSLSADEIKKLRAKTLAIIRKAVNLHADYDRYPRTWLFHDRWEKGKEAYTAHGYEIQFDTVGGRTTAWVPGLQS